MKTDDENRFDPNVEAGIADYLRQIKGALHQAGRTTREADGILGDVETHVRNELAALGREPSLGDLNATLLRMDPPAAYAGKDAPPAIEASSRARPAWLRLLGLLVLVVVALLVAYAGFDFIIAARRDTQDRPPHVATEAAEPAVVPTPAEEPAIAPPVASAPPAEQITPAAPVAPTVTKVTVAVAGFSAAGSLSDKDAVEQVVNDGLLNALTLADGVRVVERAQLDAVLAELGLGAEGLTQSHTAARVGRLLGAQVILTGRVVKLDDKVVISARLINAETGELAASQVRGSRVELLSLVDDLANAVAKRLRHDEGGAITQRSEDTEAATWRARQREVKQAIAGKKLPRVMVMIPETHLGLPVRDPAAETELVLWLTDCGFRVTSPEYEGVTPPHRVSEATHDGEITFRRNRGWRNEEGTVNISSRSLHEFRTQGLASERKKLASVADILVLGEGISERATERQGLISCKARVELKAIHVLTGEVLLATSAYGAGVDVAERIAGKRALQAAGRDIAGEIIPQLVEKWPQQ